MDDGCDQGARGDGVLCMPRINESENRIKRKTDPSSRTRTEWRQVVASADKTHAGKQTDKREQ